MVRARFIMTSAVMIACFSLLWLLGWAASGLGGVPTARAAEGGLTKVYGIVFLDANRNGIQDPGEPGIGPILLTIVSPDPPRWETTTIAKSDGSWEFAALNPSVYTISIEVPEGYLNTTSTSIAVRVSGDPPEVGGFSFGIVSAQVPAPIPTATPAAAVAESTGDLDYDIADGHFYTQANGQGGVGEDGFAVVDDGLDGKGNTIKMWSGLRQLGGVSKLGYPISRRFKYTPDDAFTYQAFQNGVIQWDPVSKSARLVNLLDELHDAGLDPTLEAMGYPQWQPDSSGGDFAAAKRERLSWLDDPNYADFKEYYLGSGLDPELVYGLPSAPPRTYGWIRVLRSQRFVFASYNHGAIVTTLVGDVAKNLGYFSGEMVTPQRPTDTNLTAWMVRGAPVAAPAPAVVPAPIVYRWRQEWSEVHPRCDGTVIRGTLRDTLNNPVNDVLVKTWNDWGNEFYSLAGFGTDAGAWARDIGEGIRPGTWHVAVVDRETLQPISPVYDLRFTESCEEGGVQEVVIHFKANY